MAPIMCTPTKHNPPFSPHPSPSPSRSPSPTPLLCHTRQEQQRVRLSVAAKLLEQLEARINGMERNTKETAVIFEGLRESLSLTDTPVTKGERKREKGETKSGEVRAVVMRGVRKVIAKRGVVKKMVVLRVSV